MSSTAKNLLNHVHDPKWAKGVSRLIKAHMAASGTTYADLSAKLEKLGTIQSPENLRVKINRGNFGAQLFVQLLIVMEKTEIKLTDIKEIVNNAVD